jgi:acetoin utilization deacetylase AcuC-like enzyme
MGAHHPECPDRLGAIQDRLIAAGLDIYLNYYDAPLAENEHLRRAHPQSYIDMISASVPAHGIHHLDPDTAMCPDTLKAALRAAGAGVLATDLVMKKEVPSAFCAVRPPATTPSMRSMGFASTTLSWRPVMRSIPGVAAVAVIDFDVHHAAHRNILEGDMRTLMVSIFQHPFYPYCGDDEPAPNMCNVPMPARSRGDVFREIVTETWLPRLREFAPEMIFISAGFDAHYEDDMGNLGLLESDYAWVTEQLVQVAKETAQGRIVSMLEGGYVLSPLARSVAAHIKALAEL